MILNYERTTNLERGNNYISMRKDKDFTVKGNLVSRNDNNFTIMKGHLLRKKKWLLKVNDNRLSNNRIHVPKKEWFLSHNKKKTFL